MDQSKSAMAYMIHAKLIRLSKSCISEREKNAVMDVLDREYLGMGVEVKRFEEALANFFNRPVACVINGTAALQLAVQASGIGQGDEVLTPSLTFIATFQAISATGAKPVACDVEEDSCLLDLNDAEKRLTSATKAIMPVHYSGGVGDLDAVYRFARKHNLRVIEDAAHAFGTTYKGKRIGSFGEIACFSFDGIKNITSGEGGCIVTEEEDILKKVKDARLLGVENDTDSRYRGERTWDFNVTYQGWRYHMSNLMATIGLEQLNRFPEFEKVRQNLAKKYDSLFRDADAIQALQRDYNTVVPHIYVVRIPGMKNRNDLHEKMQGKGIQVGYHYQPNHWLSLYKDDNSKPLPITDSVFPELITLPLHPDLTEDDVAFIASELKNTITD